MGRGRGPSNAEKREAVLQAAEALIAEHGHEVALSEICRRAGVSRQTLYNHYGGKAGLLVAMAAREAAPCPTCAAAADEPPEQVLTAYAAALLRWACDPGRAMALRARCRGFGVESANDFGARTRAIRQLAAYLASQTLRGRLAAAAPETDAALFLDLVLAGPQLRIALGGQDLSPQEIDGLSRRCARLFLRGCAAHHPRPTPGARPPPHPQAQELTPSPAP